MSIFGTKVIIDHRWGPWQIAVQSAFSSANTFPTLLLGAKDILPRVHTYLRIVSRHRRSSLSKYYIPKYCHIDQSGGNSARVLKFLKRSGHSKFRHHGPRAVVTSVIPKGLGSGSKSHRSIRIQAPNTRVPNPYLDLFRSPHSAGRDALQLAQRAGVAGVGHPCHAARARHLAHVAVGGAERPEGP